MEFQLSEEKKKHYRDRLSHFLRSHRERHGKTQQDMAKTLGYSLEHYKRIEGGNEDRIANSIEILMKFCSFDFDNVIDFFVYLENKPSTILERQLYPWEQSLLDGFHALPAETRREFTSHYCGIKQKGPWNLTEFIDFSKKMSKLGQAERMIIELMINRLTKAEFSEKEKKDALCFLSNEDSTQQD